MPKLRLHRLAAFVVLVASAAWVATGEFASVGSAREEAEAEPSATRSEGDPSAETPDVALQTVAVTEPDFIEHNRIVKVSGVTAADKRTVLATRTAGVIAELNVEKGDWVEAGDLVLMLEGSEKEAAVATARALLRQRENEAENASQLVSRGIAPKTQQDEAESALAEARSQLEAAQAEVDRLRVSAPFAGVIDAVSVEEASWATAGETVATLLSLDPIVARGEVSERERNLVKVGGEATVVLINGMELEGEIRFISREATAETRTYPVEVAIPNPERTIPAGMTAEIRLKAEPVKAVRLPRSVVTLDADGNLGVRVVSDKNIVGFVPIDLIDDTPDGLILGGVPEATRIIVAGQDLVSNGDKVETVPVGADGLAGLDPGVGTAAAGAGQ